MSTAPSAVPRLRLRAPSHQVDPRAVTWWRLQDALFWAAVLVAVGVVLVFWRPGWLVALEVAVVVVALVDVAVSPRVRYARHRWEVTDVAVYVRTGTVVEDWRVAPLSRVQTVDTQRGPLQQWLGQTIAWADQDEVLALAVDAVPGLLGLFVEPDPG